MNNPSSQYLTSKESAEIARGILKKTLETEQSEWFTRAKELIQQLNSQSSSPQNKHKGAFLACEAVFLHFEEKNLSLTETLQRIESILITIDEDEQSEALAYIFTKYALAFIRQGKLAQAIRYSYQAYKIAERYPENFYLNFSTRLARASMFNVLRRFKESIKIYFELLTLLPPSHSLYGRTLSNICYIYGQDNQHEKAIEFGEKTLTHFKDHHSTILTISEGYTYNNIGNSLLSLGQISKAKAYFTQAITFFESSGTDANQRGIIYSRRGFGQADLLEGHVTEAIEKLEWVLAKCYEIESDREVKITLDLVATAYQKAGDYEQAILTLRLLNELNNDSAAIIQQESIVLQDTVREFEIKKLEAEIIQRKNAELESMVIERTKHLEHSLSREALLAERLARALQKAEMTNSQRSKMMSTIAHEFRTPMTIIQNSAELITTYRHRLAPEKIEGHRQKIHAAISQLTGLFDDVIFIEHQNKADSPIQSVIISTEALTLSLIEFTTASVQDFSEIEMKFELPNETHLVKINLELLKHALENILNNATVYGEAGKTIGITLTTRDYLTIEIRNSGIGIIRQDIEHIFDLLYRGENVGTRRGMGLGLYIAKEIIEEMGGTISAESGGQNQGATFNINIPLNPAAEGEI